MLQPAAAEVQPPNTVVEVHCGVLQVRFTQSELMWQVRSHAHDSPQLTSRHDPVPVQSTLHGPPPQLRLLQLCDPLHVIVQDLLPAQLMPPRHALVVEHAMLQFQPVGHVTCCAQPPLSAQSMTQLFVTVSHDVHCDGHAAGGASPFTPESSWGGPTQNPSLQVRPPAQSACFSQAKSPLRWLTEQPPAVTAANPRTASQSATSFTACLRS